MSKPKHIHERIREALASGPMSYGDLAYQVFPRDQFPRAFNYANGCGGGPPGCYMALSKAIKAMKLVTDGFGPGRTVYPPANSRKHEAP